MTIQTRREAPVWGTKTRVVAGLLFAAMTVASMMAATPAQASTTFIVNSTADAPDASTASNTCDTDVFVSGDQCTLRAAIQQANATIGADTINFSIPGTGVKTIAVGATGLGALPTITEQLTIDGYTQAGAHPHTKAVGNDAAPKIVLDGSKASGLEIRDASNSLIEGLVINSFSGSGIDIFGTTVVGTRIEGNFIGTDRSGTKELGNGGDGIFVENASGATVRSNKAASRNVVSGNVGGVDLFLESGTQVLGNRIGTTASGTGALGNDLCGVLVESRFDTALNNEIGDGTAGGSNTIAFNGRDGVEIVSGLGNEVSRNSVNAW